MATLQIAANSNSPSRAAAAAPAKPAAISPLRMWSAVVGSTLGAFMAVLNIQIVNASLADIQGAIGAGTDYALLLIARYREELRRHEDRHEAMAFALHRPEFLQPLVRGEEKIAAIMEGTSCECPAGKNLIQANIP